jgi:hypothetical protein
MSRTRPSRRRGGTFTIVCLAVSTLLMVSAGAFMASTTHTMQRVGLETRRSRGREAAFAGLTWAGRDAIARGATEGKGVLRLDGGLTVTVLYRAMAEGQDLVVDAEASGQLDETVKVTGVLSRRGDAYVLTRFD